MFFIVVILMIIVIIVIIVVVKVSGFRFRVCVPLRASGLGSCSGLRLKAHGLCFRLWGALYNIAGSAPPPTPPTPKI